MTALQLRNAVVGMLHGYMGIPVVMSDLPKSEPDYPYIVYTMTTPYMGGGLGDRRKTFVTEDGTALVKNIRRETAQATFSFTVCSGSDDEALALSERAQGWFLHTGYMSLSLAGIVVREVMNAGNRSFIQIDEAARQYGFDVRFGYTRIDILTTGVIDSTSFINRKE